MKAIYGIIIAATAASLALVSCSKEFDSPERAETGGIGAERVITLTFDEATKSQISGYHPSFKAGDKILLSNGGSKEECTVSVDSYGATVTTTLTGTLKAVYPSSAAVLSGNAITGVQVSSTQHGTFAEANIAMAEDIIPGGMARFKLKTAVLRFYVDETINVKEITVTSAGADIASDGGGKTISVTPDGTAVSGATTLYDMTVGHPDRRICYVAVLPGVTASDLTFTSDTESQGIVTRQSPGTGTLAVKGMYDAFIPYYIKIHIGPGENDYQKWGYCNIGAFLPEENGDYFAWGDITGQTAATSGTGAFTTGFSWANCPFNNGSSDYDGTYFNSVKGTVCPGGVLAKDYDVANKVFGGTWYMPTSQEFKDLYDACLDGSYNKTANPSGASASVGKGVYWCTSYDGVVGCLFCDGINKLFFPAAGYGGDTSLYNPGLRGYYRSSSLDSGNTNSASVLYICIDAVGPENPSLRYYGVSVRPVYKTPVNPLDIEEYDEPENIE